VGLRLENIGCLLDELGELRTELAMLGELLELADDEPLMAECHADLRALAVRIGAMHGRVPSDNAEREAILTIEAESGEAESWTYVLWRMYVEQAERDGRRVRIHNRRMGEFGLRSVTMWIGGAGAFGWLTGERGVHHLNRGLVRPALDVRVDALPSALSFDPICVPDDELRVEEFVETWGCGVPYPDWNHSVRLTHLPTGVVVSCQGQGSTHHNREGAMTELRARLLHLRRDPSAD
jgi:protein subunit release factor A